MKPRIDFYSGIHKGLRRLLFAMAARMGAADYGNSAEVAALQAEWEFLAEHMRRHSLNEDRFMHPLLLRHVPVDFAQMEAEHHDLEPELERLEASVRALSTIAEPAERLAAGKALYRAFNRFVAGYLVHIDEEEDQVLPRLWAVCPDAELEAMMAEFKASVPPEVMAGNLEMLMPALAPHEQVGMLQMLKAGAPPEAFERLYRRVEPLLAGAARAALAVPA